VFGHACGDRAIGRVARHSFMSQLRAQQARSIGTVDADGRLVVAEIDGGFGSDAAM
jgi:hypothetical protein